MARSVLPQLIDEGLAPYYFAGEGNFLKESLPKPDAVPAEDKAISRFPLKDQMRQPSQPAGHGFVLEVTPQTDHE